MPSALRSEPVSEGRLAKSDLAALRERYRVDGFCVVEDVFAPSMLPPIIEACLAVADGIYETGRRPGLRQWEPGDPEGSLLKIAEPHQSDTRLQELLRFPPFGSLCGELLEADWVQVWAVDLLSKPPRSAPRSRVGWHRDDRYMWDWRGEVLTAWIALSDALDGCGGVRYVRGSHRWGDVSGGDFSGSPPPEAFPRPADAPWDEVAPALKRGSVVFHHRATLHSSEENGSGEPRHAIALRLRTDRAQPLAVPGRPLLLRLDDPALSPIVFRRGPSPAGRLAPVIPSGSEDPRR